MMYVASVRPPKPTESSAPVPSCPERAQWKPKVWERGLRPPRMSRPSSRRRSWHIFLHSNSNHRHSLQSCQRPPWKEKSRFRPFMYWYSGIKGIGGLAARWVNWPYQYQRLMGRKKKFIHVSHRSNFRSYSVIITLAARLGGSRSRIQARRECHFVRKPVMSSQRQAFCDMVSELA